jgi:hypothetical protein
MILFCNFDAAVSDLNVFIFLLPSGESGKLGFHIK